MRSVILDTISKLILPLVLVFSVYLLMRGHNAPGGGFIAGVMAGTVIAFQYIAFGSDYVNMTFRFNFRNLIIVGLLISAVTGFIPILFGYPFLRSKVWFWEIPFFHEVEIASAAFFDIGVFLVVVGGILTIVSTIRR